MNKLFAIVEKFVHKQKKDESSSNSYSKSDVPRSVFLKPIAKDFDKKTGKYTRKR